MSANELNRNTYLSKNVGDFPEKCEVNGQVYLKVEDLRYGTNPHQPAAFYKPAGQVNVIGDMEILKTGKSGLSQTNLEDISYALNIVKFFDRPACAVMKHVNPSGAAVQFEDETVKQVYMKARDADARAAFGSAVAFNTEVDIETAQEIMSSFVECVVAPSYAAGVLDVFNDTETYKLNRHIRIIKCGNPATLPRYTGEASSLHNTFKVLADGSLVAATPLTTSLRSIADMKLAEGENNRAGHQVSQIQVSDDQLEDLLFGWYVNISVRSNGVVIVSNGQTLSVGTGEQDRVGAVEQAIIKYREKYEGENRIEGSAMASDGFFPFPDAVETAAKAGIKAIIAPAGSLRDADVIKRANELGVALYHAPERIFSHH
ncbi:IMP cyclohydrolase [Lentisphaerota bacterium ZTH]|nr:IMP cyclohydrolase [Lentisphaerota bacterium]WET07670.1 IMP cyclohydrolase [Lentisphaerota bacterium ZTH]